MQQLTSHYARSALLCMGEFEWNRRLYIVGAGCIGNIYTLVMLQITLHNALSALLNMREFDVCIVYV